MLRYSDLMKLACAAAVAAVMVPAGNLIYPHVASEVGALPFEAIEAVVSATLGFGLYVVLFG